MQNVSGVGPLSDYRILELGKLLLVLSAHGY